MFLIFYFMYIIHKYSVVLFPAVFILRNARVYVYSFNYGNITFYIKIPVNKAFSISTILFPYCAGFCLKVVW